MARGRPYEIKRPRQQAFCRAMAASNDPEYAAWKAGYADPARTGRKMMTKPTVQREVAEMAIRRLVEEGVSMAVDTVFEIMPNKTYKPADRLKAAGMAFAVMRENGPALSAEKAGEMTKAELAKALEEAKAKVQAIAHIRDQAEAIEAEFEEVAEPTKQGVFD